MRSCKDVFTFTTGRSLEWPDVFWTWKLTFDLVRYDLAFTTDDCTQQQGQRSCHNDSGMRAFTLLPEFALLAFAFSYTPLVTHFEEVQTPLAHSYDRTSTLGAY